VTVADVQALLSRKESGKPEALVEETKAAAEKALAVVRQSVDLAAAAQRRVGELLVQRSQSSA
jgi:hypothetical protein